MKHTRHDLIKYRIDRAWETLEEAKVLAETNHWNTVANRLYYSAFYAISALFVKYEIQGTTHTGVKFQFHKEFIKTGKFNREWGLLFNNLFNKRQEGDYQDFQVFDRAAIEPLIVDVGKFLKVVADELNLK